MSAGIRYLAVGRGVRAALPAHPEPEACGEVVEDELRDVAGGAARPADLLAQLEAAQTEVRGGARRQADEQQAVGALVVLVDHQEGREAAGGRILHDLNAYTDGRQRGQDGAEGCHTRAREGGRGAAPGKSVVVSNGDSADPEQVPALQNHVWCH
jgi:hypothetical protein